jgi:hypothetical protein
VDKTQRKPLEHFLLFGNKKKLLCVNGYTCNDVDSEQNVKTTTITFLWFINEAFCWLFELYKKNGIVITILMSKRMKIATLNNLLLF